jgi:beta-fructofuranosidase
VFSDPFIANGKPCVFYTGADYSRATIDLAMPADDNLIEWNKYENNPMIANCPPGFSGDFRDPYVFKGDNGNLFMVVGCAKDGRGALTLHQYYDGGWTNDGSVFFKTNNAARDGVFWEMPAVFKLGNKWVVCVNPIFEPNTGSKLMYWVGGINSTGAFTPDSDEPKYIELFGSTGNGYGLLSPSIMQKDGKTVAIGIVPDVLNAQENLKKGWAHVFSAPREWTLDANNNIVQKPYTEALFLLRANGGDSVYNATDKNVYGAVALDHVNGKMVEIEAEFTIPFFTPATQTDGEETKKIGITVRKQSDEGIMIYYSPCDYSIVVDGRNIAKIDNGHNNAFYKAPLPVQLQQGERVKMHVFVDHSIIDVFINDRYAASVRIFANGENSDDVETFSYGATTMVNSINAWILNTDNAGVANEQKFLRLSADAMQVDIEPNPIANGYLHINAQWTPNSRIDVFDLDGRKVLHKNINLSANTRYTLNLQHLKSGLYVIFVITEKGRAVRKIVKI